METRSEIEDVGIDEVHPNPANAELFPRTLSPESIQRLAKDIDEHGQHQPLVVTPSGTIVDGHRRWLALKHLDWETVEVVRTVEEPTEDELLERILEAAASVREWHVEEAVLRFNAFLELRKRQEARTHGRVPADSAGNWQSLREESAKKAGFSSLRLAEKAKTVLESGNDEVVSKLASGELSISAASEQVRPPKVTKPSTDRSSNTDHGSQVEETNTDQGSASQVPSTDPSTNDPSTDDSLIDLNTDDDQGNDPPNTDPLSQVEPSTDQGNASQVKETDLDPFAVEPEKPTARVGKKVEVFIDVITVTGAEACLENHVRSLVTIEEDLKDKAGRGPVRTYLASLLGRLRGAAEAEQQEAL